MIPILVAVNRKIAHSVIHRMSVVAGQVRGIYSELTGSELFSLVHPGFSFSWCSFLLIIFCLFSYIVIVQDISFNLSYIYLSTETCLS